MSNLIPGNQKHLTLKDRCFIEDSLDNGMPFKDISCYLCKDPTTISKEVRLHRLDDVQPKRIFNNPHNFCTKRFQCRRTNVCEKLIICDMKCASCLKCNQVCKAFTKEHCRRIDKAPYVCNGCPKPRHRCTVPHKYTYDAKFAQRKYEQLRTSSREGVNLSKHDALKMNAIVTPLVKQGQSPYAIITNHPELDISVKTLYNYLDQGILLSRNIDLKRKPHFKPRKHSKKGIKNRQAFIGRTFADFKTWNPDYFFEMDTVLSAKGSNKCILTFYIPETSLFIGRLLNRCTEGAVKVAIDQMERALGTYDFLTVFAVCLTDRGSEFGDPDKLETGINGIERMSVYYCDPMRSGQKGGVEQVHTLLRMILPKGTVFTHLSQWDVRKCADNINSYPREHLQGQTPYQLSLKRFGPEILRALQLKYVAPDDVTLTPKLLK